MPSGSYWKVNVRCPFYHSDDGKHKILCEGVGSSNSLSLYFRKMDDFRIQMTVFCCEHYKKCEIYRVVMEKYEDGDKSG